MIETSAYDLVFFERSGIATDESFVLDDCVAVNEYEVRVLCFACKQVAYACPAYVFMAYYASAAGKVFCLAVQHQPLW